MPTILLLNKPETVPQACVEAIKKIAPDHDLWIEKSPETADSNRLKDVEISVGWRIPEALLSEPRHKWHQQNSAGVDWLVKRENPSNLDCLITNVAGMHAEQMTEQAFAMILTFARDMHRFYPAKQRKEWIRPRSNRLFRLSGKTMLIVGVGSIGRQVAKIAKAHQMRTIGIRRNPSHAAEHIDAMRSLNRLDASLPEADVVVSILPHTPGTENLYAEEQFKLMKPSAIFINIGRGIHVDESALAKALQNCEIAGAGIDAFSVEPLPQDSPLWELDDLIITPHMGGFRPDYLEIALERFCENLRRFLADEPLENLVDQGLGY